MIEETYGGARKFDTGATRDMADDKLDYEGFLSPAVLAMFGAYMLKATHLSDGTTRASDNWQLGIPMDVYMKSLLRHVFEIWAQHRKGHFATESLNGAFFNLQGYMHEGLKMREALGHEAAYQSSGKELFDELTHLQQVAAQKATMGGLGPHPLAPVPTINADEAWDRDKKPDADIETDNTSMWPPKEEGICKARAPGAGLPPPPPLACQDFRDTVHEEREAMMLRDEVPDGPGDVALQTEPVPGTIEEVSPEVYKEILDNWFSKNLKDDEQLEIVKKP